MTPPENARVEAKHEDAAYEAVDSRVSDWSGITGTGLLSAIAQALANAERDGMLRAAEIAENAKIDAEGLDIPTWGEGVGEGIGSARNAIVSAIRAAARGRLEQ